MVSPNPTAPETSDYLQSQTEQNTIADGIGFDSPTNDLAQTQIAFAPAMVGLSLVDAVGSAIGDSLSVSEAAQMLPSVSGASGAESGGGIDEFAIVNPNKTYQLIESPRDFYQGGRSRGWISDRQPESVLNDPSIAPLGGHSAYQELGQPFSGIGEIRSSDHWVIGKSSSMTLNATAEQEDGWTVI